MNGSFVRGVEVTRLECPSLKEEPEVVKKKKRKKIQKRSRGGASYLCPKCRHPSHVIITRREEDGDVRRNRECGSCNTKFVTLETRV